MRGKEYEEIASRYLKRKGYKVIERNYRTRFGEIDIVARKGRVLVFVEVKGGRGRPRYRVTPSKLKKIEFAATDFMRKYGGDYDSVRLDVVEVTEGGVEHIEGINL